MYGVGETEHFDSGKESVVIRKYLNGITGGVVLDLTGFADEFVRCGHVIVFDKTTGEYKPMPVSDNKYTTLPENYEYVGFSMTTAHKDTPHVGVITAGEVNDNALPYSIETIKSAIKAAVPTIQFGHDVIN